MKEPESKVDARLALRVYQRIVEQGVRENERFRLGDLQAWADFDGYSVTLTDGIVTVGLAFHSRVAVDTPSRRALEAFVRRLEDMDAEPP